MKYTLRASRSSLAMSSVGIRFFGSSMAASSSGRFWVLLFFGGLHLSEFGQHRCISCNFFCCCALGLETEAALALFVGRNAGSRKHYGKRDYRSKLKKLGLKKIQWIARENGKKSGRPKKSGSESRM
jgi:hypothetical protein